MLLCYTQCYIYLEIDIFFNILLDISFYIRSVLVYNIIMFIEDIIKNMTLVLIVSVRNLFHLINEYPF